GIQDLRHGRFTEPSAKDGQPALPAGVACFAIAASRQRPPTSAGVGRRGDGLVPIASALALPLPTSHQAIFYELNHFDLLSSSAVCDKISAWL
ncbi:MAG: hypothetical protein ING51_01145, partial [Rhodocyclaceae bacterium]|nr:hypothetical protein [Rhodocyclaceae bacterium]